MISKVYTSLYILQWFVVCPVAQVCQPLTTKDERGLLWQKCVAFRPCFIRCYLDTTCRAFRINNGTLFCQGYQSWPDTDNYQHGLVYLLCRERKEECSGRKNFKFLQSSGMCVSYIRALRRWHDARQSCLDQSGDLAVLDTPTKYFDLGKYLRSITSTVLSRFVWLGMRRNSFENYKWIRGNSTWAKWARAQPQYGVQQCVHLSSAGMRDFTCNSKKFFVCELKIKTL